MTICTFFSYIDDNMTICDSLISYKDEKITIHLLVYDIALFDSMFFNIIKRNKTILPKYQ